MSNSEIDKIEEQIKKLNSKKLAIIEEERKQKIKDENEKVYKTQQETIKSLEQFLGKWCVFGNSAIMHYYWKPFPESQPISYDYVYLMHVDYMYFDGNSVCICGSSIYISNRGIEIDDHFQRNFKASYILGTYKPTDHEQYDGGLRVLSDEEIKTAFEFAKNYNEEFLEKIKTKDIKPSFKTNLTKFMFLSEEKKKDLEEEAKRICEVNENIAVAFEEFMQAESKFRKALCSKETPFEIASKYIRDLNGFKLL